MWSCWVMPIWPMSMTSPVSRSRSWAVLGTMLTWCDWPFRVQDNAVSMPGRTRICSTISYHCVTGTPFTEVITSPGLRPARSAGESGMTVLTAAARK